MTAIHAFELGALAGAAGFVAAKYVLSHGWGYVLAKLKADLAAV